MTEQQKKQYNVFIAAFVRLMYEDAVSRETATEMGLCALSAFVGAVWDMPKTDEQIVEYGGYTAVVLKQCIEECYGK